MFNKKSKIMKELTIEQKAQKYDEALKKAKDFYKGYKQRDNQLYADDLESIFSELKESEDEKMKKHIIQILKDNFSGEDTNKCIAWLENQGEQKSIDQQRVDALNDIVAEQKAADKIEPKDYNSIDPHFGKPIDKAEPKFKVGDWIVYKDNIWKICNISLKTYYELLKINNEVSIRHFEDVDKTAHLWTIQDAKDGDVLACENGWTCIFKKLVNNETFSSYCFMDNTKWFCETGSECHTLKEEFVKAYNGKIYPATKEQCDLLFTKMKEAGYEWDAEKKELKKIEHPKCSKDNLSDFESYLCLMFQKFRTKGICTNGEIIDFVEEHVQKLKNTLCPTWSEEDEHRLEDTIYFLDTAKKHYASTVELDACIDWLKSLRPQPKQKWSKEDERKLNDAILFIETGTYSLDKDNLINWLKSFKDRYTWKPSEEQMNAFDAVFYNPPRSNESRNHLITLYNELKKLKE